MSIFFIFLRVEFAEFHEIIVFKAALKIRIAIGAKPPYKNVNRRHCLKQPFCAMHESIDRFLGQEKHQSKFSLSYHKSPNTRTSQPSWQYHSEQYINKITSINSTNNISFTSNQTPNTKHFYQCFCFWNASTRSQ